MSSSRRKFLKSAAAATTAAAMAGMIAPIAYAGNGRSAAQPVDESNDFKVSPTQVLKVTVRGNLTGSEVDLELKPGQLSDPIDLGEKGIFRVSCTPLKKSSPFGPVYSLVLTDINGKLAEQMNIGSNTTATFTDLGVQVYLLSFDAVAG